MVRTPWVRLPWVRLPWVRPPWVRPPWVRPPWVRLPWVRFPWVRPPWVRLPWVRDKASRNSTWGYLPGHQVVLPTADFGVSAKDSAKGKQKHETFIGTPYW